LPSVSEIVTIVLLKVAWMYACPAGTIFFSRFLVAFFFAFAIFSLHPFLRLPELPVTEVPGA
jgi:uncharacterized membrane protein